MVPGEDHWWFTADTAPIQAAIASFMAELEPPGREDAATDSLLAACAAPGEILLSVTVRDLLPGSGLEFSAVRNRLGPQCCRLVG